MFDVIEIFSSIEGEGRRAGQLTTFIRLSGCNLQCSWCDTAYSQPSNSGTPKTLEQILCEVAEHGNVNVTVTGGEPLIHKNINTLLKALSKCGCDVNVETNGTVDIAPFKKHKNVWFTMDYKCIQSGMNNKMNLKNFVQLDTQDVLKLVVADYNDLQDAFEFVELLSSKVNNPRNLNIYISAVFGKIELTEIVNFMQNKKLDSRFKLQVQLHKIIWDPEMRGV